MAQATLHKILQGHTDAVRCVAFAPDHKLLASASEDRTVRLWNLPNGELNAELKGHMRAVDSVAFSPDGNSIVTGSYDQTVRTWSVATKQQVQILKGHSDAVKSVAWSPNGDMIASGGKDKTVILWDAISGLATKTLTGHTSYVCSVSFSQNGNKLTSAGPHDNTVIIWDVNSGALIKLAHPHFVWSVCFSLDDQFVVTGCMDKIVRMFNAKTGHEEKQFQGHTEPVFSVACSFDGSIIASGSDDNSLRLWDVASTKQLQQLDGHTNLVRSVAFSRDGKFIASGSDDNTVRLWNARPLPISCFYGHVDDVQSQLDNDALVNLKGPYGFTPLHYAIDQHQIQVIQLLLERGANINMTDDQNQTAVEFASRSGNPAIISLLNQAASLQNQGLKSIPESALQQTKPFTLRLDSNQLGPNIWLTLTSSNACQKFLVGLYLPSNPSLSAVPADLPQLGALKHLSVANCSLSSDIRSIATSCTNLLSLDLSNNALGDLPDEFHEIQQLAQLDVSQCNLSSVPFVILQMKSLYDLNLSHNPLHGLPFDLGYLPLLTKLKLTDCPLTTIPREYHDSPALRLLQFLRDSQESEDVYRSKFLLVGYGEVGKTTLLTALFPFRMEEYDDSTLMYEIHGQTLRVSSVNGLSDNWTLEKEIDLSNATIKTNTNNEIGWTVQAENSNVVHEFQCEDALERDELVRTCQFLARNGRTDGISIIQRQIQSEELDAALRIVSPTTPNLALFEYDHKNKVSNKKRLCLELSAWDFAGQYEYQDGHQLFLMSRAIYLVLWDVTPSKRKQELAKLRHWLITLQLHLGITDNNMRSSVLVYIVGTHVDSDDDFLLEPCLEHVDEVLIECNFTLPHRIVDPIDARNQDYVNKLKNQLFADMAVQSHLGELVPNGYLQIEEYLLEEQKKYRLNMLRGGNDVIVPIIQRKVLSERWQRDIPYVTRALELLNLWGSIVYFGRESNKQRHVLLDELVVYAPQWLTISVLGSIVQLMRQQKDKLKKNNSPSGKEPIVLHGDLIKLSSVWQNIPSDLREHVMEMLYSLDLGFSVSPPSDKSKPFGERSSFFPQLLPFLPPRLLTWQTLTSTTNEAIYIITLNGFAMGFHGVLFSRLQSLLTSVEYGSCWQCGFLFSDVSQSILVTIHDDTQQIRICIRNSSNPLKLFNDIKVIVALLIHERYRGVRIIGEFIECACEDCKNVKWRWNSKIYDQAFNDSNIQSLCNDTTSRADLAIAIGHYNQLDGSPYLFHIEDIINTPSFQESLICKNSNNSVLVSSLKHLIEQPVPSIPVSATFPVRVALVVGNDEYIKGPLNHAVGDAVAVRNRLRELGFHTIHVFDGTKQQIDEAIAVFCDQIRLLSIHEPGVLSVIYFSGHAFQINGINLFQATTHNPEEDQYIVLQEIISQVEVVSNLFPHSSFPVCIILDACRIGEDDASDFPKLNSSLDYLFVYACRSGQVASDGRLHEGHGPFATAVLRHLQRGRSLVDVCGDIIIDAQGSGQQQPMFANSCRKRVIL